MSKRKLHISKHLSMIGTALATSWRVRPFAVGMFAGGAILETTSFVGTLYATARLTVLLAQFASGGHDAISIWFWLGVDIACALGMSLGFWLMQWGRRLLYFELAHWSTTQFHTALCRVDVADFYDENIRNDINKIAAGYTWQISNLCENTLDLCYAVVRFVVTTIIVMQIAWWLVPIIVVLLIPSLLVERLLAKTLWFVWDQDGDSRYTFWGLDYLLRGPKSQMELRSMQATKAIINKVFRMQAVFYHQQKRAVNRGYSLMAPTKLIEIGSTAIGSVILLRQFLNNAIPLQEYFFLSGALLRISSSLNTIFGALGRLQEPMLFAETFFLFVRRPAQIADTPNAQKLSPETTPEIRFENVSFTYPKQTEPVFENLSFTIAPGERIAIVGENGAGKSTLIKLLLRFYEPSSGTIYIDGIDLQDVAIESWYDKLATLFQDFNQYPMSIAENIEIGRPTKVKDQESLEDVAKKSKVKKMVDGYKHGWDTVLDNSFEKGVEPSGGQWQRVALARAFYRNAPVLILDEPTSAIDAKAEYDIFNNIFDTYRDRTAIIVSHRFSTVRRASRIVVIDKGKIVEEGSHEVLMKVNGIYADLFSKQAEGYLD